MACESSGTPPAVSPFAGRSPRSAHSWQRLVGETPVARQLETIVRRAAAIEATTLLIGETGCGKEEVARALHAAGPRAKRPFVAINCGAVAPTLVESQLFGHEKGSFTGAVGATLGMFRAADGGVLFLDEIGEMPIELQPRLLRVLQEREVMPVGSESVFPVDVQVVAATNVDLAAAVARGAFRDDLFYRLNTIEILVPPLRERRDDIPLFVAHFCRHFAERLGVDTWRPDAVTLARFVRYHWPGNVRQLAQTIERFYALGTIPALPDEQPQGHDRLQTAVVADPRAADPDEESPLPELNLEGLRRRAVRQALKLTGGHKGRAAAILGVHLNTMSRLVAEALPDATPTRGRPRTRRLPR